MPGDRSSKDRSAGESSPTQAAQPAGHVLGWSLAVVLVGIAVLVVGVWWGWQRLSVSQEQVQRTVVSTLQREAPASFYVTGTLQLTTTTTVRNKKIFLPDVLNLSMGTTEATVRMPGRVFYGFDVSKLEPEHIRLEDGVVVVTLPPLAVQAVEPHLSKMEVQTSVGWARLYRSSGRHVEQEAMRMARQALRRQARDHLETATQPRVNTANALKALLTPVLQSAGISNPQFRFRIGPELVMQPEG